MKKESITSYSNLLKHPSLYKYVLKRRKVHDKKTVELAEEIRERIEYEKDYDTGN